MKNDDPTAIEPERLLEAASSVDAKAQTKIASALGWSRRYVEEVAGGSPLNEVWLKMTGSESDPANAEAADDVADTGIRDAVADDTLPPGGTTDGFTRFDPDYPIPVKIQRRLVLPEEKPFWKAILDASDSISFGKYKERIDKDMCDEDGNLIWRGRSAYEELRRQTETFLETCCAADPASLSNPELDYLKNVKDDLTQPQLPDETLCTWGDFGLGVPCIELIWSYWHEQGMLVQTMAAIAARFQNIRIPQSERLLQFTVDPLRPLNNLLYGFIEEERHRLSLARVNEYEHEYGLRLKGKAVPKTLGVDRRQKFLAAFHNLLGAAEQYYRDSNDLSYEPDAFPVLNSLKELHRVLADGAHNQFGDLPSQARVEMLTMQWILARQEMREFLRERPMVDYREDWIGRVESMSGVQGWRSGDVTNFRDLGVSGEKILLSVRYVAWEAASEGAAVGWLTAFRQDIRTYVHAYRAVTQVDLAQTSDSDAQRRYRDPSELLAQTA